MSELDEFFEFFTKENSLSDLSPSLRRMTVAVYDWVYESIKRFKRKKEG